MFAKLVVIEVHREHIDERSGGQDKKCQYDAYWITAASASPIPDTRLDSSSLLVGDRWISRWCLRFYIRYDFCWKNFGVVRR